MFLSERWKKKIQDHEHKVQLIKLKNEVKRLEHKLLELCKEHEEDKKAAHEQSLKFPNCYPHEREFCKDVVLESSSIFDSYWDGEECFDFFPHEQEPDSAGGLFHESSNIHCHELFHEVQINLETYELGDGPIYDTYELEEEELSSSIVFSSDSCAATVDGTAAVRREQNLTFLGKMCTAVSSEPESRAKDLKPDILEFHSDVTTTIMIGGYAYSMEETKSGAEQENSGLRTPELDQINPVTAPNGLSHTYSLLCYTNHDQSVLWVSLGAPNTITSSVRSMEYSKRDSFKNCYIFKRKGVHSDLNNILALGTQAQVVLFLDSYDGGLLHHYIEDDELKDKVLLMTTLLALNILVLSSRI